MKKTAFLLMIITILSKLVGFSRDIILSYFYGASSITDAYLISMTIPGAIFGSLLLFVSLRKKIGSFGMKNITISFMKILLASLVMGLLAKLSYNAMLGRFGENISLGIGIGVGVAVYGAMIYFLKVEEVDALIRRLRKK